MDPVRQAYMRRIEVVDRGCEVCPSGGLTVRSQLRRLDQIIAPTLAFTAA
jgi:hypothetical protein